LSEALVENDSVVSLNLSGNTFTAAGAERLREALVRNGRVRDLDVSCNALDFQTINALRCSCAAKMSIKVSSLFLSNYAL
jgi:Ran GTPase-activating protein (RanGAP) involved in mRNA processing and transport